MIKKYVEEKENFEDSSENLEIIDDLDLELLGVD
jgi:hypothetical protein